MTLRRLVLLPIFIVLFSTFSRAQENVIQLSEFGEIIEQNFDGLGTGATSTALLPGWYITENGVAQSTLPANNGSSNSTGTFNFGNNSDRAIGARATSRNSAGFEWKIKNVSGKPMRSFSVYYSGEQWYGGQSGNQFINFEFGYGKSANNLAYIDVDFDFQNRKNCNVVYFLGSAYCSTAKGALNGNLNENRQDLNVVFNLNGFEIPDGEYFSFRWSDVNSKTLAQSHGMAIDDVGFIAFDNDITDWYALDGNLTNPNSWSRYPNGKASALTPTADDDGFVDADARFNITKDLEYVGDFKLSGINTSLVLGKGANLAITSKPNGELHTSVVVKENATLTSNIYYKKNGDVQLTIDSCYDGSTVIFNSNSPNKGDLDIPKASYYNLEIRDSHGKGAKTYHAKDELEVRNNFTYSPDRSLLHSDDELKIRFTGPVVTLDIPNYTGENVFEEFTVASGTQLVLNNLFNTPENANALKLDAKVTLESASLLGLEANQTLILNSGTFEHNGILEVKNDASLIFNDGVIPTGTGLTTIKRDQKLVGSGITNHWSSPVEHATLGPNQTVAGERSWIYLNGEDDNSDYVRFTTAFKMIKGRGVTSQGNLSSTFVANNPSEINHGDFLYHADAEHDGDADEQEFYLIGNPYASGLSVEAFLEENAERSGEIFGTIYLFSQVNEFGSYSKSADNIAVNLLGSTDPGFSTNGGKFEIGDFDDFSIASGQGFLVVDKTRDDDQIDVLFRPNMQLGLNDDFKSVSRSANITGRFWVMINDGKNYKTSLIGFASDATVGVDDKYDAPLAVTYEGLNVWTYIGGKPFEIQGLPPTEKASIRLPVGVNLAKAGVHEFSAVSKSENMSKPITLYDVELERYHNISESPYVFNSPVRGEIKNRFFLFVQGTGSAVGVEESIANSEACKALYTSQNGQIVLNTDAKSLEIVDLSGKVIESQTNVASGFTYKTPDAGVHVVRIQDNTNICVQKEWFY